MMRPLWQRLSAEQRGSVIPLIMVSMICLLGFVALGTDVGRLYVERQQLAGAADMAALSAAQFLASNPNQAETVAREYLSRNGVNPGDAEIRLDPVNKRITVQASRKVAMTFGRVIGQRDTVVASAATAGVAALSGANSAVPLGVARANWKLYDQVILKMSASDGTIAPGNYQALALGKRGSSMYEQNLTNGYDGWLRVGQWIETESGNMAQPTVRAARQRINSDPTATYETVQKGSPRLIMVPILKDFTVTGRGEVQIVGFGMFFLEKVEEKGSDKGEITGRFLRMAGEGEADGSAPDFGLTRTKLLQ